jgi:hypothetical protein
MDNEYLNQVIRGIIEFRKCPCCDNDGIELQAYDGNGDPCTAQTEGAWRDVCHDCEGLAFIQIGD